MGQYVVDYSEPNLVAWLAPIPELEERLANSRFVRYGGSGGGSGGESQVARRAVHEAHVRSGGPTAALRRVYEAVLEYKRKKAAATSDVPVT